MAADYPSPEAERAELRDGIHRGLEMLSVLKDPEHRKTVAGMVDYLQSTLALLDGKSSN
jgi:hypothetical protein